MVSGILKKLSIEILTTSRQMGLRIIKAVGFYAAQAREFRSHHGQHEEIPHPRFLETAFLIMNNGLSAS